MRITVKNRFELSMSPLPVRRYDEAAAELPAVDGLAEHNRSVRPGAF
ncbi:hypothetical protein [Segniliparus rotundus]|nr:hypothetical protein [Segniliparus rotundus]